MNWLGITACCVGGIVLSTVLVSVVLFVHIFRKKDDKIFDEIDLRGTHYEPYIPKINAAIARMRREPFEKVVMFNRKGKRLVANYYDRNSEKTAVMIHGYRSNPFNNFSVIAGKLLDRGFNVLFVTQHSHGESAGRFISMGRKEQYDVVDWVEYAAARSGVEKILVYGTSMGGATVGYASDKLTNEKVKVLTIDCAFTCFYDQIRFFMNTTARKTLYVFMPFFLGVVNGLLGANICKRNTDNIKNCKVPICFIHGKADDCVPISHTLANYRACNTPKKLILVPHAGHTAGILVGGERAEKEYFDFIEKFI